MRVEVLHQHIVPRDESYEYNILNDVFILVKCEKCESIFIKHIMDKMYDTVERIIDTIPPINIVHDKFPIKYLCKSYPSIENDPFYIFKMYREVLSVINSKCFWLAFCGMRAIIEQVCQDKFKCKVGHFDDMEEQILKTDILSATIKPIVLRILNATHSSIHRKFFPDKGQIIECLNILEEFLEQIYILPHIENSIKSAKLPGKNGKIPND